MADLNFQIQTEINKLNFSRKSFFMQNMSTMVKSLLASRANQHLCDHVIGPSWT